jgi:hypothetical protein
MGLNVAMSSNRLFDIFDLLKRFDASGDMKISGRIAERPALGFNVPKSG